MQRIVNLVGTEIMSKGYLLRLMEVKHNSIQFPPCPPILKVKLPSSEQSTTRSDKKVKFTKELESPQEERLKQETDIQRRF